jgi:hypothetical protein
MKTFFGQARGVCRGVLARSVSPLVRDTLMSRINPEGEDITHLRSFLDLNTRKRGWRKTRKGSGKVAWTVHQHNSKTEALRDLPNLRRAAHHFFSCRAADYPGPVVLSDTIKTILTFISINGKDWYVDSPIEYIG